ncbi:MAG: TRAP transporter substrate-binding protein [Candidatus Puniceispirillaceae bacterium]
MKKILATIAAMSVAGFFATSAQAADVTLRLHQFLSLKAAIPANAIEPWIAKVEAESGGRIEIQHYPSMQLGGAPPALYGQAKDGVVDIIWTVLGYTPGVFPTAEAFELPFMTGDPVSGSVAFHNYIAENGMADFKDVHPLALHIHGPGLMHVKGDAIKTLDDMKGKKLRGPTRVITGMLKELGATPVGMPVPAVPESLSKGVIDGAVIPYEVSVPLKIAELVDSHTGFEGERGLYTATFGFLMNKNSYNNLPADLKAIIDANSGPELARSFGEAMAAGDAAGLKIAQASGNEIVMIGGADLQKWQQAAQPVLDNWIAEMNGKGLDGAGLVAAARGAIDAAQ